MQTQRIISSDPIPFTTIAGLMIQLLDTLSFIDTQNTDIIAAQNALCFLAPTYEAEHYSSVYCAEMRRIADMEREVKEDERLARRLSKRLAA